MVMVLEVNKFSRESFCSKCLITKVEIYHRPICSRHYRAERRIIGSDHHGRNQIASVIIGIDCGFDGNQVRPISIRDRSHSCQILCCLDCNRSKRAQSATLIGRICPSVWKNAKLFHIIYIQLLLQPLLRRLGRRGSRRYSSSSDSPLPCGFILASGTPLIISSAPGYRSRPNGRSKMGE